MEEEQRTHGELGFDEGDIRVIGEAAFIDGQPQAAMYAANNPRADLSNVPEAARGAKKRKRSI